MVPAVASGLFAVRWLMLAAAIGWTLGTTHIYVGNGNLTVAPGQLGSTLEVEDGATHVIYIHYDGTGLIHVLAHAEVEYCE